MYAFIRTPAGLFKIYRQSDDWQVIGPNFERWFSVWRADVDGSFGRAMSSIPGITADTEVFYA